jgi:hypothetical protein
MLVNTVEDKKRKYSVADYAHAEAARDLMIKIGGPA